MKTNTTKGYETTTAAVAKPARTRTKASSTSKSKKGAAAQTIADIAAAALTGLVGISNEIPKDPPAATGTKPARGGTRVPDQAMSIVEQVIADSPLLFPTLDSTTISDALSYEAAMTPVVQVLTTLTTQISQTIRDRRMNAGTVTFDAYRAMKTLAKSAPNKGLAIPLQQLAPLLTTAKQPRATTLTKAETQVAAKAAKVKKVAAAKAATAQSVAQSAGGSFVPASPPVSPVANSAVSPALNGSSH